MFIARIIILLIIVAILMWLLKRMFRSEAAVEQEESSAPENMRQCKYCGTHVPESTILMINDEPYCCQQHADLDQQ
jgi:uncharacterized protein